jgi:hypothetical protein
MALTQAQKALIEKACASRGGELGVSLTDEACAFLVATIVRDVGLEKRFPELPARVPAFFSDAHPEELVVTGCEFWELVDRLAGLLPDADTYFSCLAALHKTRLKYARILEYQPLPTMDQVGPRALLQYGAMSSRALACFILWRKWIFDIDNRAGQETGYLFEPILAHAIGGFPVSAARSPIRRKGDKSKGRQVDCIRQKKAYEIKVRVTIAASGQGRWAQELQFPEECRQSHYTPVLVVLDPTPNPKLDELVAAFKKHKGETYVGEEAWAHLEQAAGTTMTLFIERYVKEPIQQVLSATPDQLPPITLRMENDCFTFRIPDEEVCFRRAAGGCVLGAHDEGLPDEIDEEIV